MMSLLFIVRVRTLSPDNGWLISIYSKMLPNDVRVQKSLWVRTPYPYTTIDFWKNFGKFTLNLKNFKNKLEKFENFFN